MDDAQVYAQIQQIYQHIADARVEIAAISSLVGRSDVCADHQRQLAQLEERVSQFTQQNANTVQGFAETIRTAKREMRDLWTELGKIRDSLASFREEASSEHAVSRTKLALVFGVGVLGSATAILGWWLVQILGS
jgi:chromosome segregation ATPase